MLMVGFLQAGKKLDDYSRLSISLYQVVRIPCHISYNMNSGISCQEEKFKMLLKERNISERELSRRTGIGRTTMREWRKLGHQPRLTPEQTLALLNELILPKLSKTEADTVRKAFAKFIELFSEQTKD